MNRHRRTGAGTVGKTPELGLHKLAPLADFLVGALLPSTNVVPKYQQLKCREYYR